MDDLSKTNGQSSTISTFSSKMGGHAPPGGEEVTGTNFILIASSPYFRKFDRTIGNSAHLATVSASTGYGCSVKSDNSLVLYIRY